MEQIITREILSSHIQKAKYSYKNNKLFNIVCILYAVIPLYAMRFFFYNEFHAHM